MAAQMTAHNETSKQFILNRIHGVLYDTKHVEPRQNRIRQLDVLLEWNSRIVATAYRVGGSPGGLVAQTKTYAHLYL